MSRGRHETRLIRLGASALLFTLAGCRGTVPADPVDPIGATVDRYLTARTELGRWNGAVLVAKDGRVILRKGYGFADVARREPFRPETQQEVASVSKMFTALAALKLRDQTKLGLDDPVCRYIDGCPDTWQPVTLRHLIHHESGIPDYEERLELGSEKYFDLLAQPGAAATILADAKTRPLEFAPGAKFHYSNTGYVVLAHALERASGKGFAELVTELILKPAGMRDSGAMGASTRPLRLATGYTAGDLGWAKLLHGVSLTDSSLTPVRPLALTGAQGDAWLYSTVDDLLTFSRLMEGSELIPPALVKEIETPGLEGYGAGWFIGDAFKRRRMRHNGIVPGYVTDFIRFPDEKTTIVLISNYDRVRLDRIARDVSAIVCGTPFDMPVRGEVIELTPEQIAPLVGDYVMTDGTPFNVRKEPDYLIAELKGRYTAGLIPLSPTEMYFPMGDGKAIFTMGADGRAEKVNMRYGGEDHVAGRAKPKS
jgi:CubicO group peptidase (beta-lactamase class C family)